MARRTKLTSQVQQTIVTAVTAGAPFETACQYAGIAPQTGHNWRAWGQRALARGESASPYIGFFEAITLARSQDELRRVARINKAGEGGALTYRKTVTHEDGRTTVEEHFQPPDWRADAFHLERSRPAAWGRQDRLSLDLTIRQAAAKVAEELGLTVEEVLAEAEGLIRGAASADTD